MSDEEKKSSAAPDKYEMIKIVLSVRLATVSRLEQVCREQGKDADAEYYLGKAHGYQQAIDLLNVVINQFNQIEL